MLEHVRRPVRIAGLETVFGKTAQRVTSERTRVLDEHLAHLLEHEIDTGAIKIVVFKTALAVHRHAELGASHAMPCPQNRPLPFGHIPFQSAVRFQTSRQVYDILRTDRQIICRGCPWCKRLRHQLVRGDVAIGIQAVALGRQIGAGGRTTSRRRAEGHNRRVTVIHLLKAKLQAVLDSKLRRRIITVIDSRQREFF